jgi:hypothetical protein
VSGTARNAPKTMHVSFVLYIMAEILVGASEPIPLDVHPSLVLRYLKPFFTRYPHHKHKQRLNEVQFLLFF